MSRPHNDTVLEMVRHAFATARAAGERKPGRPKLVKITGASEYQVRQAMAQLEKLATQTPPAHHHNSDNGDHLAITTPTPTSNNTPPPSEEPPDQPAPPPRQPVDTSGDTTMNTSGDTSERQQPRHPQRQPRPWPLALIGVAAAVAVWGGWVDLGRSTGFGMVQPLPGLVDSLWINTAIVLPIGIEAYGGYAVRTWLSSTALSKRTRRYAGWSALASLVVGAGAQVASHLMKAYGITAAPWPVTVVVACVPVAVLGLATGLATLVRQDTTSFPLES